MTAFFLFGALTAIAMFVFGLHQLVRDRQAAEEKLHRERALLAVRAADALADEIERCRSSLVRGDSPTVVACAGLEDEDSPFHWFVASDPGQEAARPLPPDEAGALRERWRAGVTACSGSCPAEECLTLAREMVSSDQRADPLVAFDGSRLLEALTRRQIHGSESRLLYRRLEQILFEDAVRRHYRRLRSLFYPEEGAPNLWLEVGRYRMAAMEGYPGNIYGFDSEPDSSHLRDFLIARNVLQEGVYRLRILAQLEGDVPRTSSVAFIDARAGFLVVEDPEFESRMAATRQGGDMLILWFTIAGLGLLVSLWLAFRATRGAMENVRLRENFVASVSHEFRSPLGGLQLMVDTLLSKRIESEDRQREYLVQMQKEIRRLSRLSENLLAMGRLQRSQKQVRIAWVPGEVVQAVLEAVSGEAESRNISVAAECPDDLPQGLGDADMIQIALLNLVENAVKFSPPNSRVEIHVASQGQFICFRVRDWGPGIPDEEKKRIFGWFYRPGEALDRPTSGTGLGLAIVREVARQHGGTVDFVSESGRGARFDLRVPLDVGRLEEG